VLLGTTPNIAFIVDREIAVASLADRIHEKLALIKQLGKRMPSLPMIDDHKNVDQTEEGEFVRFSN
jgi:hypothetical protein